MTLLIKSLSYERNFVSLFQKLCFQVEEGMLLQVQGPNGSGKTTLLRLLAGFIEPTEGQILWQNDSISTHLEIYQEKLAYLGHLNGLKHHLTVAENIKWMCALSQTNYHAQSVESILNCLALSDCLNKSVKQLSMGQQRRLSYARLALFPKPIWLLDEPITNVDNKGQTIFMDLLQAHLKQGGIAVISTHHDLLDLLSPHILQLEEKHD